MERNWKVTAKSLSYVESKIFCKDPRKSNQTMLFKSTTHNHSFIRKGENEPLNPHLLLFMGSALFFTVSSHSTGPVLQERRWLIQAKTISRKAFLQSTRSPTLETEKGPHGRCYTEDPGAAAGAGSARQTDTPCRRLPAPGSPAALRPRAPGPGPPRAPRWRGASRRATPAAAPSPDSLPTEVAALDARRPRPP